MSKECKICKIIKNEEQFFTCGRYKDKIYRRGECIECHNTFRFGKNNEYMKEYNQSKERKQKSLLYKRSEKYKINQRKTENQRYKDDPVYRLKKCMRVRIRRALESKKWRKTNKTKQYLGCSYEDLKKYIESKFQINMTWENHGIQWEIDHITPLGKAQTEEELYKLCHFSNLQPLFIEEHTIKTIKDTKEIKDNKIL